MGLAGCHVLIVKRSLRTARNHSRSRTRLGIRIYVLMEEPKDSARRGWPFEHWVTYKGFQIYAGHAKLLI